MDEWMRCRGPGFSVFPPPMKLPFLRVLPSALQDTLKILCECGLCAAGGGNARGEHLKSPEHTARVVSPKQAGPRVRGWVVGQHPPSPPFLEPLDIATSGPESLSIPASSMAIGHEELLSVDCEMLEVSSGEGQSKSLATSKSHGTSQNTRRPFFVAVDPLHAFSCGDAIVGGCLPNRVRDLWACQLVGLGTFCSE